jgi:hypothetical protein
MSVTLARRRQQCSLKILVFDVESGLIASRSVPIADYIFSVDSGRSVSGDDDDAGTLLTWTSNDDALLWEIGTLLKLPQ